MAPSWATMPPVLFQEKQVLDYGLVLHQWKRGFAVLEVRQIDYSLHLDFGKTGYHLTSSVNMIVNSFNLD